MAQIANTAIPALMGRKTFADFDREAAEFEARKRERMLKEQVQGMEMQKLQKEIESGVATNDPAAVREWQFYSQLDSDTQAKYLQMKRADQIMNLGGQMAVRNPMGGLAEAYTVTPRMVDMPEFQGMQESAKTAAQQGLPYGNTPMTPAQIEAEKAKGRGEITQVDEQAQSRGLVSKMLADMKGDFLKLAEQGAMVDETKGDLANIGASVGASGLGRFYGKITGDPAQTIRKQIDDAKPKLLLAIMRAGGASARGLDSDAELKQWLLTTGDTSSSIQANIALMDRLENLIGLSAGEIPAINESDMYLQQPQTSIPNPPNPMTMQAPASRLEIDESIFNAKKAIQRGADPQAVRQRLMDAGIDPARAGL